MSRFAAALFVAAMSVAALAMPVTSGQAQIGGSTVRGVGRLDCSDVRLQQARTRNNDQDWSYELAGVCRFLVDTVRDGKVTSTREEARGFVTVEAAWDQRANEAVEQVEGEGGFAGRMSGIYRCSQNPFDTGTACAISSFSMDGLHDEVLQQVHRTNRPFAGGRVDRNQALQLAAAAPSGAPPPPPPPPPPPQIGVLPNLPIQPPSNVTVAPNLQLFVTERTFEGEALVPQVTGQGQAVVQNMTPFGLNWSGDAHLFWRPQGVGSLMNVPINMGGAGRYRVTAHLTTAPDYARIRAYVRFATASGQLSDTNFVDFDAFSPTVAGPRPITIDVPETTGAMTLVLITFGKNAASTGLLAGLDKVEVSRLN